MYIITIDVPDPRCNDLSKVPCLARASIKSVGRPRDRDPAILRKYHFIVHCPPVHPEYSMNLEQVSELSQDAIERDKHHQDIHAALRMQTRPIKRSGLATHDVHASELASCQSMIDPVHCVHFRCFTFNDRHIFLIVCA